MPKYGRKQGRITVNTSGDLPELPVTMELLPEWWEESRTVLNRLRDAQEEEFAPSKIDFESATVWNHFHGLGRYPLIQVIDSDGNVISPSIKHVSVNEVEITHGSDTEGALILY
jgi:hypothetical protein